MYDPGTTSLPRSPPSSSSILGTRFSGPSSRAMFAWPRRPVSASRRLLHDKDSRGALAYLALAGEMLRRDDEQAEPCGRGQPAEAAQADRLKGLIDAKNTDKAAL